MSDFAKRWLVPANYYLLTAIGAATYGLLTFFSPITSNLYHLSATKLRLTQLTFVLPIIVIWFIATYGVKQFKVYASKISTDSDGKAFNRLADGLLWLVYVGTIAPTVLRSLLPYMVEHGFRQPYTIFSNLMAIVLPLIAFVVLYQGANKLRAVAGAKSESDTAIVIVSLAAAGYAYLLSQHPYRHATPDPAKYASFYLTDAWLIALVLLPYTVLWLLGTQCIYALRAYSAQVKGLIYKTALKRLDLGLRAVILFSIFLQLLTAVGTRYFSSLGLPAILILLYAIILLYGVGYVLIARGARQLNQIEEAK